MGMLLNLSRLVKVTGLKRQTLLSNGVLYEIKSPKTDKLSAVERNLKRATKQSGNIIIDSRRMSKLRDVTIQKFLMQKLKQQKTIKQILFINRKHEVTDIGDLLWYHISTEAKHGTVCSYRKASFLVF